jgi:transcriptional regulator with XRE-family HTH domain
VRGRRWRIVNDTGPLADLKAAIRAELRADGATQADLARHLGLSEKHVSQVLSGRIGGSLKVLEEMAAAVGLSVGVSRDGEQP